MPAISRLFIKAALISFLLGMVAGAAFLLYKAATGQEVPHSLVIIHTHLLTVGFLVNMVIGVAYWMFPRPTAVPTRDVAATVMFWSLNGGLVLRFLTEPFVDQPGGMLLRLALGFSGVLQGAASIIFLAIIWRRVMSARARWEREQARGQPPAHRP